jgi:hypothetical protein
VWPSISPILQVMRSGLTWVTTTPRGRRPIGRTFWRQSINARWLTPTIRRFTRNDLMLEVKAFVGVSVKVCVEPAGTVARSGGKAQRVIDRRRAGAASICSA